MAEGREALRLRPDEHREIFRTEVLPAILRLEPRGNARAFVLHGQPGIGKTTYRSDLQARLREEGDEPIVANSDLLRPHHWRFSELRASDEAMNMDLDDAINADAGQWRGMVIDYAAGFDPLDDDGRAANPERERKHRPLPIILDSNLAGAKNAQKVVDQLGPTHSIEVHAVAGPAAVSQLRTLDRMQAETDKSGGQKAPYCAKSIQIENFRTTPESAAFVDQSTDFQRAAVVSWADGALLHEQNLVDGQWEPGPGFQAAIEKARAEPLTADQQQWFIQTAESLTGRMEERYQADLHDACVEARAIFPSEGPMRDRLERVIAATDQTAAPQDRAAIREVIKLQTHAASTNPAPTSAVNGQAQQPELAAAAVRATAPRGQERGA